MSSDQWEVVRVRQGRIADWHKYGCFCAISAAELQARQYLHKFRGILIKLILYTMPRVCPLSVESVNQLTLSMYPLVEVVSFKLTMIAILLDVTY